MGLAEASSSMVEVPVRVSLKVDRFWMHRFFLKLGWSCRTANTKGVYLPYDHPKMEEVRNSFARIRVGASAPLQLCLNFDQLWKAGWNSPEKIFFTSANHSANSSSKISKISSVAKNAVRDVKQACTSATPRNANVTNARHSITCVTSTWADGTAGPLGICIPNGFLSLKDMEEINKKYLGSVHIFLSGSENHFMNASTTLIYMQELLTHAFSAKRRSCGLLDCPGLILCDAFTGNFAFRQGEDNEPPNQT